MSNTTYLNDHRGRGNRYRMDVTHRGEKAFEQAVFMLRNLKENGVEKTLLDSFVMATTILKDEVVASLHAFQEDGLDEEFGMVAHRFGDEDNAPVHLTDAYEIWVLPGVTDDGTILSRVPPFRMAIDVFHDEGCFVFHDFYSATERLEWHRVRVRQAISSYRYKQTQ